MKTDKATIKAWQDAVLAGETQASLEKWAEGRRAGALSRLLPAAPPQVTQPATVTVYGHGDCAGVRYRNKYPERYSMRHALAIMEVWKGTIVPSQLWRGHSLSESPVEINDEAKRETSKLEGEVFASVILQAGQGFSAHLLQWWSKIEGQLFKVSVESYPEPGWLPEVHTQWDNGTAISSSVNPKSLGEDRVIKWWTPPGGYNLQYMWADVHNWNAFTSGITER